MTYKENQISALKSHLNSLSKTQRGTRFGTLLYIMIKEIGVSYSDFNNMPIPIILSLVDNFNDEMRERRKARNK